MSKKITTKKILEIKKPDLKASILKEFKLRFSPRVFSSKRISEKTLRSIFEAARWTPSGYNNQPWYFYWTNQGSQTYKNIASCLSEKNDWAKTAPVFVVACYLGENERGVIRYAHYDLGAAVMAMVIEAQSHGIYARQMGLFDQTKLQKLLRIPKKYTPYIIVAMGKIGDYAKINEELLKREMMPRERKKQVAEKI